ncbi:MAG: hypothetical protein Q9173_002927 [Seirophora scorigena]
MRLAHHALNSTHFPLAPSLLRLHLRPTLPRHAFHTSHRSSNALFNLGGLSTLRESQYLAKEHRMPRTAFAPHLELIRSSEVDTQARPAAGSERSVPEASRGMVTVPSAAYVALVQKSRRLEEQLARSVERERELGKGYERRTREGGILGLSCVLLGLAAVFGVDARGEVARVWGPGGGDEGQPAQEMGGRVQEVWVETDGNEYDDLDAGTGSLTGTESLGLGPREKGTRERRWSLSRMLWVEKD